MGEKIIMAKTSEKKAEKKIVDIADFFTTTREKEGVWYEPKVEGVGLGFEFKILGKASDENALSAEVYRKEHELAEKETDVAKRNELERNAVTKRVCAVITDLRAKDGVDLKMNGETLSYSKEMVYSIIYESIEIRTDVFAATFEDSNFMTKKA